MPWFAGAPRERINWGPTIDPDTCVSCGMCMNCGKKVFDWIDGKPVVARYDSCVVGCTTCGNLCLSNAITFPPLEDVRDLYKEQKVWSKVKRELIKEGKIPQGHRSKTEAALRAEAS